MKVKDERRNIEVIEDEMRSFQQKYEALMRDIEASKNHLINDNDT